MTKRQISRYHCHATDLSGEQFRRYRRGKHRCKTCGGVLSLPFAKGSYVREVTAQETSCDYITT